MAVRQGGKYYAQVLLDLNRYKLIEELALKEDKKPTALIREFAYEGLKRRISSSEYTAAEMADNALWAQSVRRRVEGRLRSKANQA